MPAQPWERLGTVVQLAYLVEDVRVAATRWADDFGAGPFFVIDHAPMECSDRTGTSGTFLHSSAFGQWGAVQLELVQLHAVTPSSLAGQLRSPSGLHHVAMFVEDFAAALAKFGGAGFVPVMTGRTTSGMRFAFLDAQPSLGHFIEIYEPSPRVQALYARVAEAAEGWNGRNPVREPA